MSIIFFITVGRSLDVALCYKQVKLTKERFSQFRKDVDTFSKVWYQEAVKLAEIVNVQPELPRAQRRKETRTTEEYYKTTIIIPMLGK